MIRLLTGQPGHYKTCRALFEALKLKREGRVIYAHGIRNLDYDKIGFHRLDDPTKWQDLPDGSVVLIDECYSTFPSRAPGKAVPDHVEKLATHRHRGFDFILIAQQGLQLDSFIRGLVEMHVHCKRKWGMRAVKLKRWSNYQNNVNGACTDAADWVPSKEMFSYYESTVMDTAKVHIPRWAQVLALLLVVVSGAAYALKARWDGKVEDMQAESAAVSAARGTSAGGADALVGASPEAWRAQFEPRDIAIPSSAPLYDGRQVESVPRAYCMASGDDGLASCVCLTQQGTVHPMPVAECRYQARHGAPFDPFKPDEKPSDWRRDRSTASADATSHNGGLRPPIGSDSEPVPRYGQFRPGTAGAPQAPELAP